MALLGRETIAVPGDRMRQIVCKWEDPTLRKGARVLVAADETAVFAGGGRVVGSLGPGRHVVDVADLPFLGSVIDWAAAGNAYRVELYFVSSREFPGFSFEGRLDGVEDARTGMIAALRVAGDYSLEVTDPVTVISTLAASVDVTDNAFVSSWVNGELLQVLGERIMGGVTDDEWPVLDPVAEFSAIGQALVDDGNQRIAACGLSLARMANFEISFPLPGQPAYVDLRTGHDSPGHDTAETAAPPALECPSCGGLNPRVARFCAACGSSVTEVTRVCPACQTGNPPNARFCARCGQPLDADPAGYDTSALTPEPPAV